MAFNANVSGKQILEYAPEDTYNALVSALEKDSHFTLKDATPATRTLSIKSGVSWKSWGENLLIMVSPAENGMSEISINSTSKYGSMDWGKNQENLNYILKICSEELSNYKKIDLNNTTLLEDIPSQIKKLAELKDAGILTNDEFQQKKEQLLAKM